ncbi:MAG: hypothetical protein IJS44_00145, partial [Clostridia bacterium]|nr:hypothetical protein [Clostridia bacterium]
LFDPKGMDLCADLGADDEALLRKARRRNPKMPQRHCFGRVQIRAIFLNVIIQSHGVKVNAPTKIFAFFRRRG